MLGAVTTLREEVARAELPLDIPGVTAGRGTREALLEQLDDYVIPRLRSLDAPLLAVVGGSTGAGKSTLVNSIVDDEVSRSSVCAPRPPPRCWCTTPRTSAGSSTTASSPGCTGSPAHLGVQGCCVEHGERRGAQHIDWHGDGGLDAAGQVQLAAPGHGPAGRPRHRLGGQRQPAARLSCSAAADLWLFVTTAARYADAVPWDLLRQASERGTAVAIVLDRVPPEAMADIRTASLAAH